MFILGYILEGIFIHICGWVGHAFLKLITLGRLNVDPDRGSESVLAEWIGLLVLLIATYWILRIFQT
jgi:hypothetical protein